MLSGKRKRSWSTPPGTQPSRKSQKLSQVKKMARNPYKKYSTYAVPRPSMSSRNDITLPYASRIRRLEGVPALSGRRTPNHPARFYVAGSCLTLPTNIGTQGGHYIPLLDTIRLNALTAADGSISTNSDYTKLLDGRLRVELTNQSNNNLIMTIYHVTPRAATGDSPEIAYTNGLVDYSGLGSSVGPNTYIDPECIARFNNLYRITKKEEVSLGAGAMTVIEHNRYYNKMFCPNITTAMPNHFAPYTSGVFLLWHGGPVRATTTSPSGDNASIGPTLISFTSNVQVNYQVIQSNDARAFNARNYQAGTLPRLVTEDGDIPGAYATA